MRRLARLLALSTVALGGCNNAPDLGDAALPFDAPPSAADLHGAPDLRPSIGDGSPMEGSTVDPAAADLGAVDFATADFAAADFATIDLATADLATTVDAGPEPDFPVVTRVAHWRLSFADDFRGKTGRPDDAWCYDQLAPQCTVWAGANTNDCDLADVAGAGFYPPTRENLVAALLPFYPNMNFAGMAEPAVKSLYSQLITTRLADLDKCSWSLYQMVNWMATDYQGNWSARFDATQVTVDTSGKGYLRLSATYAPVQYDCVYGGTLAGPNCNVWGAQPGQLSPGVIYRVDPDPRWPGIYYPPTAGACPAGGTFTGVNCQVVGFPPHFLEESGVGYWADADPRWPGVYYANQTYRCKDNIDYTPNLAFRNLTCPILDGAVMSMSAMNRPYVDPVTQAMTERGFTQYEGRFEVKARIPKGVGAFPAAWLLPTEGGWPYVGGEIDILEARDNADEAYQTYHHGKCYDPMTAREIPAKDSAECATLGGLSVHLDLGYTARERDPGELWKRDHVYSVEWTDGQLVYYVNDAVIGRIAIGTMANLSPANAPASLSTFEASNFPTRPFYWILNHSTWVPPNQQASFAQQTFLIDYVKSYVGCHRNSEFCPCGGRFQEGVGCVLQNGAAPRCPAGMAPPVVVAGAYASACAPAQVDCPNGGTAAGARCRVYAFGPNDLNRNVAYWADADPRWPGVYYAKVNGGCPYGGAGTVNCELMGFAGDLLEGGVAYAVDANAVPPGVYYTPDFRQ